MNVVNATTGPSNTCVLSCPPMKAKNLDSSAPAIIPIIGYIKIGGKMTVKNILKENNVAHNIRHMIMPAARQRKKTHYIS